MRWLGPVTLRRGATTAGLVFAWCALWGGVSAANVLSGAAVGLVVSHPALGTRGVGGVRIGPLLRFGVLVVRDLVASTVGVAREVITPTDYTDEAIIAVDVPTNSTAHLQLLIAAITLTPGTAVVDADPDTGRLYLHLLHADRADATAAHVVALADLACRSLPMPGETGAAA